MEDTLTKNQLYYIRHRETIRQYYREWYQKNKDKEEFKNRVKKILKLGVKRTQNIIVL